MWTFQPRFSFQFPVESEWFAPDRLQGRSSVELHSLPAWIGRERTALGELFFISELKDLSGLHFEGDHSQVKGIGRGMTAGMIRIHGHVGMHLGAEMRGGEIVVNGNANDWAGCEMRGGLIRIHGTAGDHLGGSYSGSLRGMRGGVILIHGDCGHEIGSRMRRGLIAVNGRTGDFAGHSMIAGTILAGRGLGQHPGAGMKRGTIVSLEKVHDMPPSFRFDCEYIPNFLNLYWTRLKELQFTPADFPTASRYRRYSGDLLTLGKGEILERIE